MAHFHSKLSGPNWLFGRQVVLEALKSAKAVRKVVVAFGAEDRSIHEILALAKQSRVPLERVDRRVLEASTRTLHQGVAAQLHEARAEDFKEFFSEFVPDKQTFVVLLDEIQDPQNLGAVIRSAVCFGCAAVILPKWRSAGLSESVAKASSGATLHVPIVEISNLNVAVERLKEMGFFVYGADVEGEPLGLNAFDFPAAIVVGNEHRGIKPVLRKECDRLFRIPQKQTIASLNVSNAAAIFFYEASRGLAAK